MVCYEGGTKAAFSLIIISVKSDFQIKFEGPIELKTSSSVFGEFGIIKI